MLWLEQRGLRPGRVEGLFVWICVKVASGAETSIVMGVTWVDMFMCPRRQVCDCLCIGHVFPDREGGFGFKLLLTAESSSSSVAFCLSFLILGEGSARAELGVVVSRVFVDILSEF